MKFSSFLIKDTSGKKSLTATAFVVGFLVVNAKFLLSGVIIEGVTIATLTGIEYAAAISGLGAIYVLRRSGESKDA